MIIIENNLFTLKIGEDCVAKSLVFKSSGEECILPDSEMPLFSITMERPFHNEIKLIYPNKRTTYSADRVRMEGNKLIVGFELVEFEAVVEITKADNYITFTLAEIIVPETAYGVGCSFINPPPISEFRLMQLPVLKRERFGNWLNVCWDDNVCVNVLATSPYTLVDSDNRKGHYMMYAESRRDIKLIGTGAALIVSTPDNLLNCIDTLEVDYDLPRGAKSRLSYEMDSSIFWTNDVTPENIDEAIEYAKKCGFKKMLIYYTAFFSEYHYNHVGNYEFKEYYPNGFDDVAAFVKKIKDAGITPGIHTLHSHIGVKSRYVTPVADHRLNLTRNFTLANPLGENDDVIYVEQNPEGSPLNPKFQILKFDGEVIFYESYSTEYPYCFKNCKRGHFETNITPHNAGTIGGVLDISEFGTCSVYIDQRTSLQDEIIETLSKLCNCGFEFIYFDGSEGTNPPFEFNVSYAQHKLYKSLNKEPLFCEGAAKTHFSWHMLSGGNAFDVFPFDVFKEKIAEYPVVGAQKMESNFTTVDFGWWAIGEGSQPDMYEYATSKATAYNCPGTIRGYLFTIRESERKEDIFEVLNRWEDAKSKKWFTKEQKEMLKNTEQEYILLVNESGEYELVPYYLIRQAYKGNDLLSAFWFERLGKTYVVCWHNKASGKILLPIDTDDFCYEEQLGGNTVNVEKTKDGLVLPVEGRRYFSSTAPKEKIIEAFKNASFID